MFCQKITRKKTLLILVLLIFLSFSLSALPAGDSGSITNLTPFSHARIAAPAWVSAALWGSYMISQLYFNRNSPENGRLIENALLASVHLPMYLQSPGRGLILSGSFGSLVAIDNYTRGNGADPFLRDFIRVWPMEHALYSTYAIYKYGRQRAKSGLYNDNWRENTFGTKIPFNEIGGITNRPWRAYNFGELMIQPFQRNNMRDLMVLALPFLGFWSTLIRGLIDDDSTAIWQSGEAYIGQKKVHMAVAIPAVLALLAVESGIIATTEESFFRGFVYEEIGHNYGGWAAKVVDMVAFPLFHMPGEIGMDYSGKEITGNFLRRSVLTVYLDTLYDRGGLGRSVAAHFWIDFSIFFTSWLVKGGKPMDGLEDIMQGRDLFLQVQMPF